MYSGPDFKESLSGSNSISYAITPISRSLANGIPLYTTGSSTNAIPPYSTESSTNAMPPYISKSPTDAMPHYTSCTSKSSTNGILPYACTESSVSAVSPDPTVNTVPTHTSRQPSTSRPPVSLKSNYVRIYTVCMCYN